jgi:type II secretory pathway pseudopilin PulG
MTDSTAIYLTAIAFLAIVAVPVAIYFSPKARRERALKAAQQRQALAALEAQAQAQFDVFVAADEKNLPDLTSEVQGVILKGDEVCYALSANAHHIVSKTKTHYVGGSQGVSFRVAKGVRYHVGGYRGHPVTEQFEVVADSGTVYVTSKRLIFAGTKEVTTVPVPKIADVHIEGARVVIIVENRVNPLVVGITQPFWAPVIAAAAHCSAQLFSAQKPSSRSAKR